MSMYEATRRDIQNETSGRAIIAHVGDGEVRIADVVERECPGFWKELKRRNPKFLNYGKPDGPPIGYLHGHEVHEAMIEFLPVYIAELKARG